MRGRLLRRDKVLKVKSKTLGKVTAAQKAGTRSLKKTNLWQGGEKTHAGKRVARGRASAGGSGKRAKLPAGGQVMRLAGLKGGAPDS